MSINKRIDSRVYKIQKGAVFYDPTKYDFASAIFDKNIINTFVKSGLHDVAKIVQKELADRNLLDSIFIEMNIIGTLLEEKKPDMLNSLVYIREGLKQNGEESSTPHFAENVQTYSNAIIKELYKRFGYTIFYHPDVFIDQKEPQVPYSVIEPHVGSKAKLHLAEEIEEEKKQRKLQYHNLGLLEMDFDTEDSGSEPWVGGKARIVVGNSQFKRDYEEIIKTAKSIREKRVDVRNAIHQFHRYYHSYFARKHRTVYMAIPIQGAYAGNRINSEKVPSIQGQGVVFLFFTIPPHSRSYDPKYDEGGKKLIEAIDSLSECLFERIGSLIRLLTYNYLFNLGINLAENVKRQAVKSAVSAIMSRNMSHNLGSHCMHYTKNTLDNLSGQLHGHGPDIRGAARLISYIQGRMDFLATLVSGEEYPYGAVNFKSQIIDVLNVDYFSKRHYKASTTSDKYKAIKKSQIQLSLNELSYKLDSIIKNKKERSHFEQEEIVDSVVRVINQLENLKLDNADLRTTNFLLENLIKSERFYRENIYDIPHDRDVREKPFYLHVCYNGKLFTGSEIKDEEESLVKNELSELNIALPGGLMSTHAFFNIVENLIRNSAKHRAVDLTENALITRIDIRNIVEKGDHRLLFTIYDNKHNAKIAYPIVIEQLKSLSILNSDTSINKKSKGMKEMLVAALWLKSNEFEDNYADILCEIDAENDGDKKLALIKKYSYELVKVDSMGNDSEAEDANFGLRFSLPIFETCTYFTVKRNGEETIAQSILNSLKIAPVRADIVAIEDDDTVLEEASKRFPRIYDNRKNLSQEEIDVISSGVEDLKDIKAYRDTLKMYSILKKRFGADINQYQVIFGDSVSEVRNPAKVIYFQRHFSESEEFSSALEFPYADSVSGGNFTVTLKDHYMRGHSKEGMSYTWKDKYFSLKIIESALTRITIIDERLSADYNGQELMSKNLRVLNLNAEVSEEDLMWSGSSFKDDDDYTLFLSIHLGLIEKIVENKDNWYMKEFDRIYANQSNPPARASFFMEQLRKKFGKGKEIFISIHSGRGNYSYELEHSLKEYPFINLSAIESVFTNSKYLLAQLFYNTVYIGKGVYNQNKEGK